MQFKSININRQKTTCRLNHSISTNEKRRVVQIIQCKSWTTCRSNQSIQCVNKFETTCRSNQKIQCVNESWTTCCSNHSKNSWTTCCSKQNQCLQIKNDVQFKSFNVKYQQTKNDVLFKLFNANTNERKTTCRSNFQNKILTNKKRRVVRINQYQTTKNDVSFKSFNNNIDINESNR